MDKRLIVGVFKDIVDAEALLSNLSEADFALEDISVIAKDTSQVRAIHDDIGPLQGTSLDMVRTTLIKYGLPEEKVAAYDDAIKKEKVLIAMYVDDVASDAACEMFHDNNGIDVQLI